MTRKTDYEAAALALLTRDNRKPNIEAMVKAYMAEAQELEDAAYDQVDLWALPDVPAP